MLNLPDNVASCIPFIAAGVQDGGAQSKQVVVRLAEVCIVVGFLMWQMDDLKNKVDTLQQGFSQLRTDVAVVVTKEEAVEGALDQAQDRLKNIASRVRDLEQASPRTK